MKYGVDGMVTELSSSKIKISSTKNLRFQPFNSRGSLFSKIYSPIVEISSDLVEISSELVLTILELLIISTFGNPQKTAVHTLILLSNEPLIELLNFVSIKK